MRFVTDQVALGRIALEVRRAFGNKIICTGAAVSVNNKVTDRADYHGIVQC